LATAFTEQHLRHLQKWLVDPAVHRNLYALYRPMDIPELTNWLKHEQKDNARMFFYHTDNDTPVGMGLVHYIHPKHDCGELSIIVNPDCSGKGFGRRILLHLMDCAFNKHNLHKIFFHCTSLNTRMIYIAEQTGFMREGLYREEIHLDGTRHNIYRFGMLADEYAAFLSQNPAGHTIIESHG